MKKIFRQYLALFLMGSFAIATSACGDDDNPNPIEENEQITTVELSMVPTKGNNVTATWKDTDGAGGQAPTITSIVLKPNITYTGTVKLLDESKTPAADLTTEIKNEGVDHELFFNVTGANVTITKTDKDTNGRTIGLEFTAQTTTTGTTPGTLQVVLKHQPGIKNGNQATGETDIEVTFPISVQL
ncbi:hypothetical protein [Pontibacter vulgaris]|uniref:hypothetical protein n=1 Tax=Pontibacter vulgaris TaxID=2905679 RepID=UPI001FA78D40|nr:hypothetical protein [Pontibacter vulgaris]